LCAIFQNALNKIERAIFHHKFNFFQGGAAERAKSSCGELPIHPPHEIEELKK
jgi:hypothetical protein